MERAACPAAAEQTPRASFWTTGWCGRPKVPVGLVMALQLELV